MKNLFKRTLAMILTVTLCVSMLQITAFAKEIELPGNDASNVGDTQEPSGEEKPEANPEEPSGEEEPEVDPEEPSGEEEPDADPEEPPVEGDPEVDPEEVEGETEEKSEVEGEPVEEPKPEEEVEPAEEIKIEGNPISTFNIPMPFSIPQEEETLQTVYAFKEQSEGHYEDAGTIKILLPEPTAEWASTNGANALNNGDYRDRVEEAMEDLGVFDVEWTSLHAAWNGSAYEWHLDGVPKRVYPVLVSLEQSKDNWRTIGTIELPLPEPTKDWSKEKDAHALDKYREDVERAVASMMLPEDVDLDSIKWTSLHAAPGHNWEWHLDGKLKDAVTLTYDANGGTNPPQSETVYLEDDQNDGEKVTFEITNALPTREGYTFLGWSEKQVIPTEATVDSAEYMVGVTGKESSISISKNTTLYAVWTNKTPVYVYVRFEDGQTRPDDWVQNGNDGGWCTVGYLLAEQGTLPAANTTLCEYPEQGAEDAIIEMLGKVEMHDANGEMVKPSELGTHFTWKRVEDPNGLHAYLYGLHTAAKGGAENYMPASMPTWHLDGQPKLYKYTVIHEYYTNGVLDGKDESTKEGTIWTVVDPKDEGVKVLTYGDKTYTYTKADPEVLRLIDGQYTITLRYDRTVVYQVNYTWSGLPEDNDLVLPTGGNAYKEKDQVMVDTTFYPNREVEVNGKTYVFSGWTTSDATVANGSFSMPDKNVTISGTWTEKEAEKFTVAYRWTGLPEGSGLTPPTGGNAYKEKDQVTVDTSYGPTSEVVVNGKTYTFSGWTTSDATVANGSFSMPDKNVTISGTWTEKSDSDPEPEPEPEPNPEPEPEPEPTPEPEPEPTPTPAPRDDEPDEPYTPALIEIDEPDVPMAYSPRMSTAAPVPTAPADGLIEILDEEVPLAGLPGEPGTGIVSHNTLWTTIFAASLAGLLLLFRKDEEDAA